MFHMNLSLTEDSQETSSPVFSEKEMKTYSRLSSAAVVNGALMG